MSRRSFVKVSTASVAAMSVPAIASARQAADVPAAQQQQQARAAAQNIIPAWRPGDSDSFTRYYFDSLMLETRYLDSDIPSTKFELFGETFDTPIMTAALSHLHNPANGIAIYAQAAADCNAVHWMGMGEDKELEEVIATGAKTIKVIKPHRDNAEVFRRIKHAIGAGCFAIGMDIDHSFNSNGEYDVVMGVPMKNETFEDLKSFVKASRLPFIVKGVLSVSDARKCLDAGVAGIVLSHHGGRVKYSIPPLMALEPILDAVGGKMKIFLDCGVVSGMDAYKALALGVDAVSVGRHLMPLVQEGVDAVAKRMKAMTAELAGVMAATGVKSLDQMDPTVIHKIF
ncbi:MAG: alpha-hydroxy-acid oxidizing protein [Bacteroidales bacterium]|nr:alpha-hydroxy-acid oxidizing protein [Bacteroidales bacterium]